MVALRGESSCRRRLLPHLVLAAGLVALAVFLRSEAFLWAPASQGSAQERSQRRGFGLTHGHEQRPGHQRYRSREPSGHSHGHGSTASADGSPTHTRIFSVIALAAAVGATTSTYIPKQAAENPSTHGEVSRDSRKLRTAIESILRDQEDLRIKAPIVCGRTIFSIGSTVGLAMLASGTIISSAWYATLLPAFTSGIFIYTSVAESLGARSMGVARYNSAKAVELSSSQESILADAETYKAFVPFGVGLTAIFASACVALKLFDEEFLTGADPSFWPGVVLADLVILALGSVAACVYTNDQALIMYTCLSPTEERLQREDELADETEEASEREGLARKLGEARLPDPQQRAGLAVLSFAACSASLPAIIPELRYGMPLEELIAEVTERELLDEMLVVLSATAAAVAAVTFLVAENYFAEKERRIALQSKQAALSELFYAQSQAEAAIMAARSASSGVALAGAEMGVEFSRFLAAAAPWPVMVNAIRSTISAAIVRVEADATYLERELSRKGRGTKGRKTGAMDSALREAKRLLDDFASDNFSNEIRGSLQVLSPGGAIEFKGLSRDKRRKVHVLAAELGMESQSIGQVNQRVVKVTNMGVTLTGSETVADDASELMGFVQGEARRLVTKGVPPGSELAVIAAATITAMGAGSPLFLKPAVADLLLPLATSVVGLTTVYQEREGKETSAIAKRKSALLLQRQSTAEAYAAMPTYFAVSAFAMAAATVGTAPLANAKLRAVFSLMVLLAMGICSVTMQRYGRLKQYIDRSLSLVDAKPLPDRWQPYRKFWWVPPTVLAVGVPCDIQGRIVLACASVFLEIGLVLGAASKQLAAGEYFLARSDRVVTRIEAWSQNASQEIRRLPLESAIAISTTLLSTTAFISGAATAALPVVGFVACVRALQLTKAARDDTVEVEIGAESMQQLGCREPWLEQDEEGLHRIRPLLPTDQPFQLLRSRNSLKPLQEGQRPGLSSLVRAARFLWVEQGPDEQYAKSAAERVVRSVQADLDELRQSVGSTDRSWVRTGLAVAAAAAASVASPFVLPLATAKLVLPVAGAGLTLFVVASESDARRSVSASKLWASEVRAVVAMMEELGSTASLYRCRLLQVAGLTAAVAGAALAIEEPWLVLGATGGLVRHTGVMQTAFQAGLVLVNLAVSTWSVRPLNGVLHWSTSVQEANLMALREAPAQEGIRPGDVLPPSPNADKKRTIMWSVLAALPSLSLALWPRGTFAKRAVASTAAGALVVAGALMLAEITAALAERATARRMRTLALVDAFSEEAEQQGALLPVASAATIAISGLITFATEFNPFVASALTLFQAITWVLASRKAAATSFESVASFEVDSVTERPNGNTKQTPRGKSWLQRARDLVNYEPLLTN
eukprot:TRINITY_DN91047_c0_g1_i2.p1 TRINITY_DN91047_c0_g1~~TRINITY_DN91047_c0_g1_i2.p1  ORF type:complete len:1377 (-),score=321.56 TRINITY_DN91047_c0_g1_i2:172-4302(-)